MWFIPAQHPVPCIEVKPPSFREPPFSIDSFEAYDLAGAEPSSGVSGLYMTNENNICPGGRDLFRGRPVTQAGQSQL